MKYATLLVLGAFQAAFAHIDEFLQTGVAPPYQHGDSDAVKMTPPPLVDCRGGPIGVHFGATVDVTNNIPHGVSVRAIAFAKDGSKRVCDGVEGWSKPHFRVAVDDSVEYVMFVPLPSAAWDVEVWRTKSGQWPTAFTLNGPSEAKLDVSDEPKSCTKKLQQLCGHCGTNKNCWVQCAKSHEGQLLAAGCKKPSSADVVSSSSNVGGEPKSCTKKLQQLCGHCGTSKNCWVQCAKSHEGQLLAAGCKKPSSNAYSEEDAFGPGGTEHNHVVGPLGPGGNPPPSNLVGGEPSSCKKKLKKLCGHCGTNKNCWVQCAKSHEGQLLAAGCKKPSSADAVAQTEGFVAHQVDAPDHDHCEEIMIPGTHEGQLFWKTMS